MNSNYPKGAEWRKWDLHLHSPASYDYKDKSTTNADIIDKLSANNISVAAITDHHVMDIERIKNLQQLGDQKEILIIPGIEFLSDARGSEPVHFIGLFAEDCNLDYIWGQLQNKTEISKISSESKKENEVYCDLIDTINLIHDLGGIVTIHSGQKHGSVETITNSLAHTCAQKSDIAQNVDIFELGKASDQDGYRSKVFPAINKTLPMIICSDNHDAKNYLLKENCWLKADPTFEGLKQVIIEPEERVFIGDRPPLLERIPNNRTKFIKELSIKQTEGYDGQRGEWFNNITLPLNSELVAIIGNKGSGKSAIADILSLCSNHYDGETFSFIHKDKFREKKGRIAKNFKAMVTWEDTTTSEKNLNDNPDNSEFPRVKYLPQGQFEKLTNEINTIESFQREIESVVFSHIPDAEKLRATSFPQLIEFKTSSINEEVIALRRDINGINKKIIGLERKTSESYRKETEQHLLRKQGELTALIDPPPVSDPNEDPEKKKPSEAVNHKINKLKESIKKYETEIRNAQKEQKDALEALQQLKNLKSDTEQKISEIKRFISDKTQQFAPYDLNIEELISVKSDFSQLDALIKFEESNLELAKSLLGKAENQTDKPLSAHLIESQKSLTEEQAKLDGEQKRYQEYLSQKDNRKKQRQRIIGAVDLPDTIESYKRELAYLDNDLSAQLESEHEKRRDITRKIFQNQQSVIQVYKEFRDCLKKLINDEQETLKDYKIEVDASLVKKTNFSDQFLGSINKNKRGTFYSTEEGEKQFLNIISETNFDNEDSIIKLLNNLVSALLHDQRPNEHNIHRDVQEQVKDVPALYDYLFSLKFLENHYQLKQGGKGLEQLSPGERGALLLVFYLLLDHSDIPLIIDQPEDNLDNQSVATVLVPFIREAKKRRQIIMVTHNPNLAVVSDAEQIIYANLDKENNYSFSTISGSIENKLINKKIVEVLEGAMPAFNMRKRKYYDQ